MPKVMYPAGLRSSIRKIINRDTITSKLYEGVPMSLLNTKNRGLNIEEITKNVDEHYFQMGAKNPKKDGKGTWDYDFQLGDKKVEVKSAQLCYHNYKSPYWDVCWRDIKPEKFDEIRFVLYTPIGLYFFNHTHESCEQFLTKRYAKGHLMNLKSKGSIKDIDQAIKSIVSKLGEPYYTYEWERNILNLF